MNGLRALLARTYRPSAPVDRRATLGMAIVAGLLSLGVSAATQGRHDLATVGPSLGELSLGETSADELPLAEVSPPASLENPLVLSMADLLRRLLLFLVGAGLVVALRRSVEWRERPGELPEQTTIVSTRPGSGRGGTESAV